MHLTATKMSTRALIRQTREDSHYVVRYTSDSTIQIRQRSHIKTYGAISVGETHPTQWGSAKQVDDAVILHAGEYNDMRIREREERDKDDAVATASDDEHSPLQPPPSPEPASPPPKRRRPENTSQKAAVVKNLASVIGRANPAPQPDVFTFTDTPESESQQPQTPSSTVRRPCLIEPLRPLTPSTPITPSVRSPIVTDKQTSQLFRMVGDLSKRVSVVMKRQEQIEQNQVAMLSLLQRLVARETNPSPVLNAGDIDSIPSEYRIDEELLIAMKKLGPGNFAKKLTVKLFPELFGADHLRLNYSWYGKGVQNKQPLDQTRKDVIYAYVTHYFPETKPIDTWKDVVVPKINEGLRRPADRLKKVPSIPCKPTEHHAVPSEVIVEENGSMYTRL